MKITFFLKFHTHFGQKIFISGDNKYLGDNKLSDAVEMTYFNDEFWMVEVELAAGFNGQIHYRYILKDVDGLDIYDAEQNRFITVPGKKKRNITRYILFLFKKPIHSFAFKET